MDLQNMDVEVDTHGVATVRLNRPPANAVDRRLMADLLALASRFTEDPNVRVVVLGSAIERFFVAGADLSMIGEGWDGLRDTIRAFHAVGNAWEAIPVPTIAAIGGIAAGAGCEIALTCDIRIMATGRARIGVPEAKVGLLPSGGGTQRLPRLIGRGAALNMLLRGDLVPAEEAFRVGLVTEICAPQELDVRVSEVASQLASLAPLTLREIKRCAMLADDVPLHVGLLAEEQAQLRLRDTVDTREGVNAFLEKRAPHFKGR